MNDYEQIKRDNEAARRGIKPKIINEIPMRPHVAESFDDAKVPFPNIETEQKD